MVFGIVSLDLPYIIQLNTYIYFQQQKYYKRIKPNLIRSFAMGYGNPIALITPSFSEEAAYSG